ncbi:methionine--tRNA ligase [Candidatus Uhrbacteria bacterium]|nr:methionine--tRNA ligase [Candidatus Uhrbacteria bacterium]
MLKKLSSTGKKFYITTPIYYVNDVPHIGHAYTTIAADVLARYYRARGEPVRFLCGTDENAQKNVEAALRHTPSNSPSERGRKQFPPLLKGRLGGVREVVQQYVDEMSAKWQRTWDELQISNDDFIRTTEPRHVKYVEKFWGLVKKGDIYKGQYEGLYCTGCEAYKTETELVKGKCPDHNRAPEKLSEENYFFKLSAYRKKLLAHIKKHPEFIQPEARRNEVTAYIRDHTADFSISRKNLEWGIPVPGDPSQTIYVWFDALLNYISAVTPSPPPQSSPIKGEEEKGSSPPLVGGVRGGVNGEGWWPADLHLVGKDIIKFHCAYWPAMLMSAGLPLPRTIFAHGFFTVDGQKMSKTIGNVVDPVAMAKKYGNDVLRYYLMREIPFGGDGDFSEARLRERYNGELANGLGNLVARVLTMVEKYSEGVVHNPSQPPLTLRGRDDRVPPLKVRGGEGELWQQYESHMAQYQLDRALDTVWKFISALDALIDQEQPWKLAKHDKERLNMVLYTLAENLRHIAWMLLPFMPETAGKIFEQLGVPRETSERTYEQAKEWGGLKSGTKIERGDSLFPRLI